MPKEIQEQEPRSQSISCSLQDYLLSIKPPRREVRTKISSDFGVGPPPRYKNDVTTVTESQLIFLPRTTKAA
jgi:hypothetical protein